MTSPERIMLIVAAAAALTIASSIPGEAQIVYPYPPYGYAGSPDASVHIDVTPQNAEVYVDGYYAGVVDDFDGMLQRLRVEPGQHEITLYLEGFRATHQRVYLARDRTFRIKQQMEKLPAGEAGEPRPVPAPLPAGAQPPNPPSQNAPPDVPATGRLTIQVQPIDSNVLIDGQPWPASPGQQTVVLDLSEGRHLIQVRKPGYVGYLTEVEVRRGETTTVTVSLRTQP